MCGISYTELETLANNYFSAKASIVSDSQHMESLEKIQYLESMDRYGRSDIEEGGPRVSSISHRKLIKYELKK